MRLLNTSTLELHSFEGRVPHYAILSHTWEGREFLFHDVGSPNAHQNPAFAKVKGSADLALSNGIPYIWIDTCCIDKSSSAELSEAINSMYKWYAASLVCYVYLSDLEFNGREVKSEELRQCRWFSRGWTLQELLAPSDIFFYDRNWKFAGTKLDLREYIAQITGISKLALQGASLQNFDLALRMSWASRRETTRPEDMAYCLLGIFDVNMPLLYGEGAYKAFTRLQTEIMSKSDDHTLFVWTEPYPYVGIRGLLARSPAEFSSTGSNFIAESRNVSIVPHLITNRGAQMELYLRAVDVEKDIFLAFLECMPIDKERDGEAAIYLKCVSARKRQFFRIDTHIRPRVQSTRRGFDLGQWDKIFISLYNNDEQDPAREYSIVRSIRPLRGIDKKREDRVLHPASYKQVRLSAAGRSQTLAWSTRQFMFIRAAHKDPSAGMTLAVEMKVTEAGCLIARIVHEESAKWASSFGMRTSEPSDLDLKGERRSVSLEIGTHQERTGEEYTVRPILN